MLKPLELYLYNKLTSMPNVFSRIIYSHYFHPLIDHISIKLPKYLFYKVGRQNFPAKRKVVHPSKNN